MTPRSSEASPLGSRQPKRNQPCIPHLLSAPQDYAYRSPRRRRISSSTAGTGHPWVGKKSVCVARTTAPRLRLRRSGGEDLARVEDAVGVEKRLEAPHHGDGLWWLGVADRMRLHLAQAVLCADAAPPRSDPFVHKWLELRQVVDGLSRQCLHGATDHKPSVHAPWPAPHRCATARTRSGAGSRRRRARTRPPGPRPAPISIRNRFSR